MSDWSFVLDARDLTDELLAEAIESRADVRALLERLSQAISPNTGAGRVLLLFARMATSDCDWLEGGLRIDVIERDGGVVIETFTDIGGGLKERALPTVTLKCPLSELVQFIASDPKAIAPLVATRPGPDRLHLAADEVEHDDDDDEIEVAPPPAAKPPAPPRPDLKQTQIAVVRPPEKAAAPIAHLPTIEAPKVSTVDELPPVSDLKPGEIPPPIEFDDLEPPSSRRPDQKPLARIALKKQVTRNLADSQKAGRVSGVVEEPHSSKRGDDRSE